MTATLPFTVDEEATLPECDVATVSEWLNKQQTVAIDTETSGLEWDATVRLVQFGNTTEGHAISVETETGRATVRSLIQNYSGTIVFHNAAFDIHALERIGVDPEYIWPRCWDTYIMAHILEPADSHGLKALAVRYLSDDSDAEQQALKKAMRENKWTWATVPLPVLVDYAIKDTVLTAQLFDYLSKKFDTALMAVLEREMEIANLVYEVESNGLRLDRDYATELKTRWQQEIDADKEWFAANGIDNPNANRQIAAVLREQGWEPAEKTPSGEDKLDKTVLKELADAYPIAARLLDYKRKVKWLSAYVDNSLDEVDANGYVHARYNSLGARTGRMSCSNPPLQQLPTGGGGEVRRLFLASAGNVIASVDYSAIELRLAGALSGEPRIIEAYANGEDIYQQVADSIGSTRTQAKVVVLASLYGAGGPKIGESIGIDANEAQKLVDAFWAAYPILSRWVLSQTNKSRRVRPTSMWGRKLSPHAPYAAANAIIQGTAAEVLKDGLLRLAEKGLIKYVAAIVHDEVVLDVPASDADRIASNVAETLEDTRFAIPLIAEPEVYGPSWADGYK